MECNHPTTVQIAGQVSRCSTCKEVFLDETLPPIDWDHYDRIRKRRDATRRQAIQRNRRPR